MTTQAEIDSPSKTLSLTELAKEYPDKNYSTYQRWAKKGILAGCIQPNGHGGKYSILRSAFEDAYRNGTIKQDS